MNHLLAFLFSLALLSMPAASPGAPPAPSVPPATTTAPPHVTLPGLDALYPSLDALYRDLHQNPELSLQEEKTAAKLAARLRELGYEVTEKVGGHGIVGVLRNGEGPTILLRADMDALPIKEETGLPYASTVTVPSADAGGAPTPVMHACGHDVHMTAWVGAAALLAQSRAEWRGTLVFVGQPAEELVRGAAAMVRDGLYTRFPKPDYALGIHVAAIPAGQIGIIPGPASAASNAVNITFHGRGGHGAAPHRTIDPIVIAARAVVALQTIVSREISPFEPAVVTVGTIHAGTKRNIIPDDARIELTVRSYKPAVQKHLLEAIARIARAEAAAAAAPREPTVEIVEGESAEVVVNTPELALRLETVLGRALGTQNLIRMEPFTTSEDFGVFGRAAGNIPSIQLRIGAIAPDEYAKHKAAGTQPPGTHTSKFAPDRERTIRTATAAFVYSARELLAPPK